MFLQRIKISNFKNIVTGDLHFSSKINCICGSNGEGKTNLLDAIFYLSMTKSFLNPLDQFVYRHGSEQMALNGVYLNSEAMEDTIAISVKSSGEKIIKRNAKPYSKLSEHIGYIPIVVISPLDASLINDSGEERRRFMNIILSQTDKEYLRAMQSYNRILQQRNKLLKQENLGGNDLINTLMETFNERLSKESIYIYEKRRELISQLSVITQEFYETLSGGKEQVSMNYVSDLNKAPLEVLFQTYRERDKIYRYTTVGLQRDDISFNMDNYLIKKCSSQGQQKTFLIALKLAQYSLMKQSYGFSPILLLDDLFDKLDDTRVEYLIGMVANDDFGQIFITDTNRQRINAIVESITKDSKFFDVKSGEFE